MKPLTKLFIIIAALGIPALAEFWIHQKTDLEPNPDHVVFKDIVAGKGPTLEKGKEVTVTYTTRIYNGRGNGPIVSDTRKTGQTFTFTIGANQVMRGWEEGIQGLRVGGLRKIMIPPQFAYGAQGTGQLVPPNSTLEVEIELLKIKE